MAIFWNKDRLELFLAYLQQLLMESVGKMLNLNRNLANKGIVFLGNKGSTDQYSYVQQLREGLDNFFITFIEVLADGQNSSLMVEVTSGDFLHDFYFGTRQALAKKNRTR